MYTCIQTDDTIEICFVLPFQAWRGWADQKFRTLAFPRCRFPSKRPLQGNLVLTVEGEKLKMSACWYDADTLLSLNEWVIYYHTLSSKDGLYAFAEDKVITGFSI